MCTRNRSVLTAAFTLIELLVVVAIIGLLISILLPSLQRAKAQARQLMCSTNLRSQGEASNFYAQDNGGWIPRAIQGFGGQMGTAEYHIYSTAILPYLGWTGDPELGLTDANKLWNRAAYGVDRRDLNAALRKIPQLQCPDYPPLAEPKPAQELTNPVDYVASAFPIPYLQSSIVADSAGDLEWDEEGEFVGESVRGYHPTSKLDRLAGRANPAGIIYVTEAHTSLTWTREGPRFHHVFLASQLPFGGRPRMANDQRHPGGINALFFDGHAENMDLHYMDPGWPNPLDRRLRWFTIMPDDYQP
jgi:prepilin-type processing-associated H-X9-DG protein/prepilin-type N-terminal cleavage/methylation domain-containing protein